MRNPLRSASIKRLSLPYAERVAFVLLLLAICGCDWQSFGSRNALVKGAILHEVERDDFELAITERGEIESAGEVEVRSEVTTKNQPGLAILRIVREGDQVRAGDFLVELDSSALREERTLQQITVNAAEAVVIEAKNLYETAIISKREYLEGTFVQEKETFESELFVAEENLSRAIEYLKYSEKLAAKGYVSELQLQADKFAVDKARKEADAAKTKIRVLEEFTRAKMIKQFESDIAIAKAKWESTKNSLALEEGKLRELDDQILKCTIHSPKAGVVKYAHVRDRRGNNDFVVEEGAVIRERQVILTLPDITQMRVEMNINEALVQHIKPGMPAEIHPIGSDGLVLRGTVQHVNQYAEPSGWRKANIKEYKAYVQIDGSSDALRSGMTASVTIRSMYKPDVIQVPVQAIYLHGADSYCFVSTTEGELELREVVCGPTNDSFYVIQSGLAPTEQVAVNPRALLSYVELPELPNDPAPAEGGSSAQRPVAESKSAKPKKPLPADSTVATNARKSLTEKSESTGG